MRTGARRQRRNCLQSFSLTERRTRGRIAGMGIPSLGRVAPRMFALGNSHFRFQFTVPPACVVQLICARSFSMKIDAAVESVLLVVESHHGLRVKGHLSLVTSSMPNAKRP